MVNYHDPATIVQEYLGVVKLWHFVDGIFIWEFVTTLDFEWDIIRGHRPYRWTIWVYSFARLATLWSVILNMIGLDTTTPINCQAWVTSAVFFADIAFIASSLLIMLRVIAIWNKSKIILAISMTILTADTSILFYCLVRIRSTWSPEANTCLLLNFDKTKPAVLTSLITDIALLLIMLFGLLRMRIEGGGAFVLGRVLWNQGLIWLLLATVAEVPTTVLVFLNLNVSLNLMTQTPSMVIVSIAATRVYRGLVTFGSSDGSQETPRVTGPTASDKWARSGPIPLNRMEVTVQTQYDQHPASQGGLFVSTDLQKQYKSQEVTFIDDVESGPEK